MVPYYDPAHKDFTHGKGDGGVKKILKMVRPSYVAALLFQGLIHQDQ